jgi:amino acid permease
LGITAVSGFISWCGIAAVHIRFRRAFIRQGRSLDELPYHAFLYPYSGLFASILCILIILGQGYVAFYPQWDTVTFFTSYIGVVPFILCYVIHKLVTRKKVIPLEEVGKSSFYFFFFFFYHKTVVNYRFFSRLRYWSCY